ncbi:MAG: insulinase family protein [Clostridiales bacterium]|jgi:predicted Zn-dependent peptidase|nr:insulinase family protein [Clostridiales bacterium]
MQWTTKTNDKLKETLIHGVHKSGLKIYLMPKSFNKTYAIISTKYGAVDLTFATKNAAEKTVPHGIAHFLEHKLFEQPGGGNAFDLFATTGASANAFTSFCNTAYLFSATSKVSDNLRILLDFVFTPYFTDENINKEQGIIAQEIKMYDDNPNWRVFFNLLECLYVNHPIKIDIAGTVESIAKIDKDLLYHCYNTFYNPYNMTLFIAGNISTSEIEKLVDELVPMPEDNSLVRAKIDEPDEIAEIKKVQHLSVATPLFLIGFKDNNFEDDILKKEIITDILMELIFGKGSKLYEDLYSAGLINETFACDFDSEQSYAFASVGGESPNPDEVLNQINNYLPSANIASADFERVRNMLIGDYLRKYNDVEDIGHEFIAALNRDEDYFSYLDVIDSITIDDINRRMIELFKSPAMSVILPKE